MDTVKKSSVRLGHWVEHNLDHLKSYAEVVDTLEKEGLIEPAGKMKDAIQLMRQANQLFEEALDLLSEKSSHPHSADSDSLANSHPQGHSHSHTHKHIVEHSHEHHHTHEHSHGESSADGHEHVHEK